MAEIIPAILPKDFHEIETKLGFIKGLARHVQIDICDGKFVPSVTWPYGEDGEGMFNKIVDQEAGMPYWEDFDFEFDLMVKEPHEKIPDLISCGATRVIVHLESADDKEHESIARDYGKQAEDFAPFAIELGIAVRSTSDLSRFKRFADSIHFVQVMGIKNVGFQHQPLDEASLEMIRVLRRDHPELIISVDGGVSLDTAKLFTEAGADRLVVGSAIFDKENPAERLKQFQNL